MAWNTRWRCCAKRIAAFCRQIHSRCCCPPDSLTEHLAAHPEIGLSDYQKLQALIDRGEIYAGADDTRVILLAEDGVLYRGAVKVDQARRRVDLLTWFRTNETSANRDVRQAMRRLR